MVHAIKTLDVLLTNQSGTTPIPLAMAISLYIPLFVLFSYRSEPMSTSSTTLGVVHLGMELKKCMALPIAMCVKFNRSISRELLVGILGWWCRKQTCFSSTQHSPPLKKKRNNGRKIHDKQVLGKTQNSYKTFLSLYDWEKRKFTNMWILRWDSLPRTGRLWPEKHFNHNICSAQADDGPARLFIVITAFPTSTFATPLPLLLRYRCFQVCCRHIKIYLLHTS